MRRVLANDCRSEEDCSCLADIDYDDFQEYGNCTNDCRTFSWDDSGIDAWNYGCCVDSGIQICGSARNCDGEATMSITAPTDCCWGVYGEDYPCVGGDVKELCGDGEEGDPVVLTFVQDQACGETDYSNAEILCPGANLERCPPIIYEGPPRVGNGIGAIYIEKSCAEGNCSE